MPGAPKTADQLKQAIILRGGGYSLAAIANKTGISPATLSRHFKKHSAPKGAMTDEAIALAREQLLADAGFIDGLKRQIAASITDDLSHVIRLREAMAITLEDLLKDKDLPPHYRTRGLAALATSLRLTQETARKALNVDNLEPDQETIPVLSITELTAEDIQAIHDEQREMGAVWGDEGGGDDDDNPNEVIEYIG